MRGNRSAPPAPGKMPIFTSGNPNVASVGGDTEIAGDGQLGAARESEPTHGRDGRHRQGRQRFGGCFNRRRVRGPLVRREHPPLLEIGAGTEGTLAGSGHDDRPDIVSPSKGVTRRQQFGRELLG